MAFCVNCGRQIREDVAFCPYCGKDLRSWKQTRLPETPVQEAEEYEAKDETVAAVEETAVLTDTQEPVCECTEDTSAREEVLPEAIAEAEAPVITGGTRAMKIVGMILGIHGFATGLGGGLLSLILLVLLAMGSRLDTFGYETIAGSVDSLFTVALEGLAFSIVGLILQNMARKKGLPEFRVGRIFALLGIALGACMLADLLLMVIVFAFTGTISMI